MKVTMTDISNVKNGTMTKVLINKKSIGCLESDFYHVMASFTTTRNEKNYFRWNIPSNINYKYFTHMNVGDTEKLFMKFRAELIKFSQTKK